MKYIGEHLIVGQLGNFFVVTSFCFALLAMLSYFYASKNEDKTWKKLANISFIGHTASVFGIVAVLFYMLMNQYFEYYYVWQHSSKALPLRYIFSCFWEGQEGSFLLLQRKAPGRTGEAGAQCEEICEECQKCAARLVWFGDISNRSLSLLTHHAS
jgi:predicted membrane protein